MSGLASYLQGQSAEDQTLSHYLNTGHRLICRRWRGRAGEIDLVLGKGDDVVFVEVKSSSRLSSAAQNLSRRQIARLLRSAEDCLGHFPRQSLTPMRFDLALVDGAGRLEIHENALMSDMLAH